MNSVSIDAVKPDRYRTAAPGIGLPPLPPCRMPGVPERALEMPCAAAVTDAKRQAYFPLPTPADLKRELPADDAVQKTVRKARKVISNILLKKDPRLLVIAGPCSIHDEASALEYARRLADLGRRVSKTMFVVMRAYLEKPRTCTGWKGLVNDPHLNGTCDLACGLRRARKILAGIHHIGLPVATEMLDPTTPAYIGDLISWAAIGARTVESQTHREMASGLAMPVGFKNSTDGDLLAALNAVRTAATPQTFPGIDQNGRTMIVKTTGNPSGHLVLRGGKHPNYHSENVEEVRVLLREKRLPEVVVIDCSHGNSNKDYRRQPAVWHSVVRRRLEGDGSLVGLMLESHLHEGRQSMGDPAALAYGVSLTDACIGWEETEHLLTNTHATMMADARNRHGVGDARRNSRRMTVPFMPGTPEDRG